MRTLPTSSYRKSKRPIRYLHHLTKLCPKPTHYHLKHRLTAILCFALLMTILGTAFAAPAAHASCAEFRIEDAVMQDEALFAGEVIRIAPKAIKAEGWGRYYDLVLFEVESNWKGAGQTQLILRNDSQSDNVQTSIDQSFVIGQKYLVFAYERDSYLQTNTCKGTKLLSTAAKDLAFLGPGEQPSRQVNLEQELAAQPWTGIGEFLKRPTGWITGGALLAVLIGVAVWAARRGRSPR